MREIVEGLGQMKVGVLLALVTLLFGFGLGGAFGAFEDDMKHHLAGEAEAVLAQAYAGDAAAAKKVTDKAWVYFKRAHLHANGLGTSALALMLLMAMLPIAARARTLVAAGLGAGALGYALFWLLAGLRAPGLGGTGAAKESLEWLSIPASGLCILGLVAVIGLTARALFGRAD